MPDEDSSNESEKHDSDGYGITEPQQRPESIRIGDLNEIASEQTLEFDVQKDNHLSSNQDEVKSKKPGEFKIYIKPNYFVLSVIILILTSIILSNIIANYVNIDFSYLGIVFITFILSIGITAISVYGLARIINPLVDVNAAQSNPSQEVQPRSGGFDHKNSQRISQQLRPARPAQPRGYNPIIKTQKINGVTRQIAYYNPNIKVDKGNETIQNWSYIGIALGIVFIVGAVMNAGVSDDMCTGFCGLGVLLLTISGVGLATVADNKSTLDQLMILLAIGLALTAGVVLFGYLSYLNG